MLSDYNHVPAQAVSASKLCHSTLENKLTKDAILLVNLDVQKQLTFLVDPVSCKQWPSVTKASKLFLSGHLRLHSLQWESSVHLESSKYSVLVPL